MAIFDMGTFAVQYDDERKQYFVSETLEGNSHYVDADDIHGLMHWIEAQIPALDELEETLN